MEKEFNLSEKITGYDEIEVKYIKEFIKRLKENKTFKGKIDYIYKDFRVAKLTKSDLISFLEDLQHTLNLEIDKLAGEKLK